jgi:hypothetical protein
VLVFNGRVINDLGEPLEGALVQFWHTDINGNYDHPNFNTGGVDLLPDFQYFGTANTTSDGTFLFRTHRPGIYAQRPITHIHYKVWWKGSDVLTSQFYFSDENTSQPPSLQLTLQEQEDGSLATNKTITLNLGLGGSEPITPSQTSGPFYPVVNFFELDSDMTVVKVEEQKGTSTMDGDNTSTTNRPVSLTPSIAPNVDVSPASPTGSVSSTSSSTGISLVYTDLVSLCLGALPLLMFLANP